MSQSHPPRRSFPQPPRLADRFLEWFVAPHLLESLQGDLHEEFDYQVAKAGLRRARWRYWREVLGFVKPFAIRRQPSEYSTPTHTAMFRNYLKTAIRNLVRHRVSTLINLTGLTLGVTACLVIYVITSFELHHDTFHPDRDRIYRLVGSGTFGPDGESTRFGFVPQALPQAFREEIPNIEAVAAFHNIESEVLIPNGREKPKRFAHRQHEVDRAEIIVAEPQYFAIFRYKWLAGNPATALREPGKVVLTERKARKYFGDLPLDQMLGREVIYRDSVRVSVSGIVQDWQQPTDLTFTDFISFATIRASTLREEINLDEWNDIFSSSQAFVKLPAGVVPSRFSQVFAQFTRKHFTQQLRFYPALQPLSDLHFDADYVDNYSRKAHLPTLYGLMGVAFFILLIAAINFVNLATAQSIQRAREIGIRKVLGSSRKALMAHFLSETFILTVGAMLLALLLVKPILSVSGSLVPLGVRFDLFSPELLAFLAILAVLTTLLSGFYPALALSAYQPALTLKGQSALAGNQKGRLRQALIVFQFTISLVFIISTLMVGRQLNFMRNKDLGFSSEAVLFVSSPGKKADKLAVLQEQVRQLPAVRKTALQVLEPMGMSYGIDKITLTGKTPKTLDVAYKLGDENYVGFYEMKLLAGRPPLKSESSREMVINETMVKALGFREPARALNQLVTWRDQTLTVVGVVADFHQLSMREKIAPTFITTVPYARSLAIKLRTRDVQEVQSTLGSIEERFKAIFPDNEFEYTFMDDTLARFYENEQKTARLVNTATALAILISCMGLFGLALFTAERRTKEIGIRKVLGASFVSILTLLSVDFIKLVLLAILLASPLAWYAMHTWLTNFVYKVELEWWVFVLAGLLAMLMALLTVSYQSIKAAQVNPARSLQTE